MILMCPCRLQLPKPYFNALRWTLSNQQILSNTSIRIRCPVVLGSVSWNRIIRQFRYGPSWHVVAFKRILSRQRTESPKYRYLISDTYREYRHRDTVSTALNIPVIVQALPP